MGLSINNVSMDYFLRGVDAAKPTSSAKASSSAKAAEGIRRLAPSDDSAPFLLRKKKATDSRPSGLPSIASATDGGAKVDLLDCRFELVFSPQSPFTNNLFPYLAKAERN